MLPYPWWHGERTHTKRKFEPPRSAWWDRKPPKTKPTVKKIKINLSRDQYLMAEYERMYRHGSTQSVRYSTQGTNMPKHGDRRPSKSFPGFDEVYELVRRGAWIPVGHKYCNVAFRYVPYDRVVAHNKVEPWFDEETQQLIFEYHYTGQDGKVLGLPSYFDGLWRIPLPSTGWLLCKKTGYLYKEGQVWYKEANMWYDPGHKYSPYWKKWYKEDEEIPRPVWSWKDCGLTLHPFLTCCGAKILYGFGTALYKDEAEAARNGRPACWSGGYDEAFERELKPYRGRATGMILAILNLNQQPVFEATLLKHGFKLLSKHANLNHGPEHWNYLYGFGCLENAVPVAESASMFGAAPPQPVDPIDEDFDDDWYGEWDEPVDDELLEEELI